LRVTPVGTASYFEYAFKKIQPFSSNLSPPFEHLLFFTGDVIGVAGNHWDGFNKGRNHRSNRIGLYPEYKTSEQVKVADFPNYAHVDL
jgi:hypothetical protein